MHTWAWAELPARIRQKRPHSWLFPAALLETAINGAKGVIINITSSPDIGLEEIEIASSMITKQAHEEANIIWGAAFDETMEDELSVTVIATGFTNLNGEEVPSIAASASLPGEPKPAVARSVACLFPCIRQFFRRRRFCGYHFYL